MLWVGGDGMFREDQGYAPSITVKQACGHDKLKRQRERYMYCIDFDHDQKQLREVKHRGGRMSEAVYNRRLQRGCWVLRHSLGKAELRCAACVRDVWLRLVGKWKKCGSAALHNGRL
jgi:hypothetical protein